MATLFVLTMQDGPTPGLRFELSRRSLLLGRDPASDLPINDGEVSRRHARFIAQSGGYAVEDLGSTNGTFVDGQRIKSVMPLQPGAVVRFGDNVTFIYEVEGDDEALTQNLPPAKTATPSTAPRSRPQPMPEAEPAAVPHSSADPVYEEAPPAAPMRRRERRKGFRLPVFSQRWAMPVAIAVIIAACATSAFLWYVDANFLWCDVFGGLIPACG
jgi:pSer/pThr/pTyr-binding forkhead associated (FHA) protein